MFELKYIKDLNPEEKKSFYSSNLLDIISAEYYFLESSIKYYGQYHEHTYTDKRFVVFYENEPVLAAYLYCKTPGLSYFHFPFSVFYASGSNAIIVQAHKVLLKEIDRLCSEEGFQSLLFYANPFLISRFFGHIKKIEVRHFCEVDLSLPEDAIKSNIRKSYKSLVNWGKNNLAMGVCDSTDPNEDEFRLFREFHREVAGRSTRAEESWNTQYEMIQAGEAFLVTARLEDKLVSANLVMNGTKEAFYAVGVNDRELMNANKPISHYPLLYSIYEAKRKGFRIFNMNEVDLTGDDPKKDNIAKFKNGFSSTLRPAPIYHVTVQNSPNVS